MLNLEKIADDLSSLTVIQASELAKILEKKWNVSAASPVAAAVVAAPVAAAVEQTSFEVVLTAFGDKKIDVIKVVREITNLGLKEAKDLVEAAPKQIVVDVNKTMADEVKSKLEAVGAKVEVK